MEEKQMERINGHWPTFIVDEANRVVVAEVNSCTDDIQNELFGLCQLSIYYSAVPRIIRQQLCMPWKYRAVARCAPDDEFDAEVGRRLALARLKKKYWERYAKRMEYATAWLGDIQATLQGKAEKAKSVASGIEPVVEMETATTKTVASGIEPLAELEAAKTKEA